MNRFRYLLGIIILLVTQFITAQTVWDTPDSISHKNTSLLQLEETLEELSMENEEVVHWENELEELSQRIQEPLNLNAITRQQLEQFPFLNAFQIENILAYVYIHGSMQSIYELQMIDGMDRQTIQWLLPFVCVKPLKISKRFPSWKDMFHNGKHQLLTRLDVPFYAREGYKTDYLGPSWYHSLRYSFRYGDFLQFGVVGEKDAGEPLFALHNKQGYDFYSYYLLLQHWGRLEALALGNYRLNFGQGLVLGNSFGIGKTFSLATSDYHTYGIRKHASCDEYNFFRGIAGTLNWKNHFHFTAFYSHRSLDGVVKNDKITSIYRTGLHRSKDEVVKKNQVIMQVLGSNITYEKGAFRLGTTGVYYFFDRSYEPNLRKYAKYQLHGNHFYNASIDYRLCLGKWMASGEIAKGKQGFALLNRMQYAFTSDYRVMLLHRFYSHDYWSFFAHGWGESRLAQNENGWYIAAEAMPWSRWRFFTSFDFFSFPWWKYRISKPSKGWEGRFQITYMPHHQVSMFLNYQYKEKERDITGSITQQTGVTHRHKIRYRLTYQTGDWLLKSTADYVHFHTVGSSGGQGWQVTQSCGYSLADFPLIFTVQGTWFHTTDYDTRVYAYEKSLLNSFYTPSFYGKGYRCSAHVRYDLSSCFMLLLKIGHTHYLDRTSIGVGNDLIASNQKTDLQMQLRIKF